MEALVQRGRPCGVGVDARIVDAALELLLDRGYDRFSVDEVAGRVRIAKAVLHRRWPTKDHLIVAVVARLQGRVPLRYSGDIGADLVRCLNAIADGLNRVRQVGRPATAAESSAGLVAEVAAAAARHADVGAAVQAEFARSGTLVLALLEQARKEGELRPDADAEALFDQLAGALYYRLLITGRPIDAAYVERVVESALDGATS